MARADRRIRRQYTRRQPTLDEQLKALGTPAEKLKLLNAEYGALMDRILNDARLSPEDKQDLLREMVVSSDLAQMPEPADDWKPTAVPVKGM